MTYSLAGWGCLLGGLVDGWGGVGLMARWLGVGYALVAGLAGVLVAWAGAMAGGYGSLIDGMGSWLAGWSLGDS
jgi:hypothetical protein